MQKEIKTKDYFTAQQIIERNPYMEKFWNAAALGYFLRFHLVKGVKKRRGSLISEKSVIQLYRREICGILEK